MSDLAQLACRDGISDAAQHVDPASAEFVFGANRVSAIESGRSREPPLQAGPRIAPRCGWNGELGGWPAGFFSGTMLSSSNVDAQPDT